MADKLTPLMVAALRKSAAEPAGLPLLASRGEPGLFPSSAPGKQAAEKAIADGWLRPLDDGDRYTASDIGLARLLEETTPRQVLNDCVRALEARQQQLTEVEATLRRLHGSISGLRHTVERVLPTMARGEPEPSENAVLTAMGRWQAEASEDCPLPELYRQVELVRPGLTVGAFHDALRRLHDDGQVYLHPWTGPLYALPEPTFALLVGHEIAYYASGRAAIAANGVRQPALAELS